MTSDNKAALTELLDQGQVWAEHMVQDSSPVFVHVLMAAYLLDSGWLAAHDAGVRADQAEKIQKWAAFVQERIEKVATAVSAAYEEMDGLHRPMSSPMGRLLHDVNGELSNAATGLELIRHAVALTLTTEETEQ